MNSEKRLFVLALIEDTVFGILVLSAAFLIAAGGLSLMKWAGVF